MAAPFGDVGLGNSARHFRGRPLPRVHDGVSLFAPARARPHDGPRGLHSPPPTTREPATSERGVGSADGGIVPLHRSTRRSDSFQLVDMAPRDLWGQDFIDGVDTWSAGLTLFATNYATSEPPRYAVKGGALSPVHSGMMVSSDRALRMSYDYDRGAVNLEDPPLHVICCSLADPTRAPLGLHTVKVVAYQPYQLSEGPGRWDAIKRQVSDTNLDYLRRFSPNLTDDKILASTIESPLDLERMNPHNWHGSCHAGESGAAQSGALRPMPGWAGYRMPIPGLYQTGACTAPGGSVTGTPGRNAAIVMLKDFATSIEEVVGKSTSKKA